MEKEVVKALDMKIEMCNNVKDFHNSCQSCESYSPVNSCCRLTGDCFPVKCFRYLHIIGQKRRALRLDKREMKEIFETKNKQVKQLELW